MKAFRDDIHAQMDAIGRPRDECKIFFTASPVLGETSEEANARAERERVFSEANLEPVVANYSRISGIDFSTYDWDVPLEAITTNGHQGRANAMVGRTIREIATEAARFGWGAVRLVGTPDEVAAEMGEIMEEVGGDGFLISKRYFHDRYVAEIADGLVPALQRRGLMRTELPHDTFRENLLAF